MANEYRKTESWMFPTALLCMCGVFNYLKPSEPFLTPYLMGPEQNLTSSQLVNSIYPVWIYSYLASLIPVFLITDYVKYKPVIIAQGIGYISCWLLLCFASGVQMMQLMQFFYGVATAGEIGYYSYIYIIVDSSHYQKVTSYVRASTLLGLFLGSILSQLLVSFANLSYFYLHVISLVNVSLAFLISLFLPMPKKTIFFYISDENSTTTESQQLQVEEDESSNHSKKEVSKHVKSSQKWKAVVLGFLNDMKVCYTNKVLLRWSIWWALSTCGWILVVNYVQNLWETIVPSQTGQIYNGAVETVATVLGALGAFGVGFIKLDCTTWGEMALGFFSLLKCGLLMVMYLTDNIWICYSAYVIFIILYNVVITITQFQLAIGLTTESFALVFGVNTFAAVLLNTVLTVILIDKAVLGLDVRTQFIIYSVYFGIVALIFLAHSAYSLYHNCCHQKQKNNKIPANDLKVDDNNTVNLVEETM